VTGRPTQAHERPLPHQSRRSSTLGPGGSFWRKIPGTGGSPAPGHRQPAVAVSSSSKCLMWSSRMAVMNIRRMRDGFSPRPINSRHYLTLLAHPDWSLTQVPGRTKSQCDFGVQARGLTGVGAFLQSSQ
jgi:hypothetical protein